MSGPYPPAGEHQPLWDHAEFCISWAMPITVISERTLTDRHGNRAEHRINRVLCRIEC